MFVYELSGCGFESSCSHLITFDIQLFLCHPIRKLLASINQSSYLIYYVCNQGDYFADIDFFYLPSFVFKEIQVIVEGDNPSEKNVIVKEEPDGIDTDGIGNLEDLLRIVFIHKECGNLKVFVGGGELTRNIDEK